MDKLQSVTPENRNSENQRGSTNGVASLISALLDNVTESKVTESKVTESKVTESKVTESKVTESKATESEVTGSHIAESKSTRQQSSIAEQTGTVTVPKAADIPFSQDSSWLSANNKQPVAPVHPTDPTEFSPISKAIHEQTTLPNGHATSTEDNFSPVIPVNKIPAQQEVVPENTTLEKQAAERVEREKANEFLQSTHAATVTTAAIVQTDGTLTEVANGDAISAEAQPSSETYQSDGMAINIKGRTDGVLIEIGRGNWEILVEALRRRLEQAGGFFRGGNVALDLAERSLQESDLRLVFDVLVGHNMKPALVRTSSDRTFQSALMLGLAGTLESMDGRPLETVQAAPSNQESQTHYVYRGALRSGQVLKRRSHVLIIGDVNPGSEVIATGDILIWGRLRGTVHAGVEGDKRAVVAAFDIDPVQLKIADAVAIGNSTQSEGGYRWIWSRNAEKRPEVARLVNGQITIEPWDEAKTGGSPVLKKRR